MPQARHHHRALSSASPEVVWERLQNPSIWASVAGVDETSDHEFAGPELVGFGFASKIAGINYRGRARVTTAEPRQAMTLEIRSNEMTGDIAVTLSNAGPGTELSVTMTMRPVGLIGSMVFGVANAAVTNGFAESVERLARELS